MSERILPYLPDFYRGIKDFTELDATESAELGDLEAAVQQLFDDQFVLTSSADAVKRREQMLGIQADPTTESLEFRKRRILNRYQTKPPFTVRYLQQQLDRLIGPGRTIVEEDAQNFLLVVTAAINDAEVFREVEHTIKTIKPANIVYQQNTALNDDLELVESIVVHEITWNYVLGSWQLGAAPFATLGPEVPVK
jgi:uncharacterized protein YmfQ (DUF2313 family)